MLNAQTVMDAWLAVFPNSSCYRRNNVSSTSYVFCLAKDISEVSNGYMNNDPLCYMAAIDNITGDWKEYTTHMYLKPTVANMCYSSENFRKKTIKSIDAVKVLKRFQEVRVFVMNNKDKLKDPLFDINTK